MTLRRVVVIFLLLWMAGTILMATLPDDGQELVADLTVVLAPVLAGLLIASVGVFLGSLGNLYAALGRDGRLSGDDRDAITAKMQQAVDEIRQNAGFVIVGTVVAVLLPHAIDMTLPGLRWPFEVAALGPAGLVHGVVFAITVLIVYAVWDSVKAMFVLHTHYREILQSSNGQ